MNTETFDATYHGPLVRAIAQYEQAAACDMQIAEMIESGKMNLTYSPERRQQQIERYKGLAQR